MRLLVLLLLSSHDLHPGVALERGLFGDRGYWRGQRRRRRATRQAKLLTWAFLRPKNLVGVI